MLVDGVMVMSLSAWIMAGKDTMKAEDVPLTKGSYSSIPGRVAIFRGISAWFVQECNGQECDGTMVWW
jgi:hypothetical protein